MKRITISPRLESLLPRLEKREKRNISDAEFKRQANYIKASILKRVHKK